MLITNNVTLCGLVMPCDDKVYINSLGHKVKTFILRTAENWSSKYQNKIHYEYHKIVLKDTGSYNTLSKYQCLIVTGNKLLVEGKLRYRVSSEQGGTTRFVEIDAYSIDLMAIVDKNDALDLRTVAESYIANNTSNTSNTSSTSNTNDINVADETSSDNSVNFNNEKLIQENSLNDINNLSDLNKFNDIEVLGNAVNDDELATI